MNITNILQNPGIEKVTETTGQLIMGYIRNFIDNPFIVGLITLFVVLLFLFLLKVMLDRQENFLQNRVLFFGIHFFAFFVTIMVLIGIDMGSAIIMEKLRFT